MFKKTIVKYFNQIKNGSSLSEIFCKIGFRPNLKISHFGIVSVLLQASSLQRFYKSNSYAGILPQFCYNFKEIFVAKYFLVEASIFCVSLYCKTCIIFSNNSFMYLISSHVIVILFAQAFELWCKHETLCAICYPLYNLKNVKNTHRGVLLLVKFQASASDRFGVSHEVTDLPVCFLHFLDWADSTKLRKTSNMSCLTLWAFSFY